MITNELLEAKYNVQKQMNAEAKDDLKRYVENAHDAVREAEEQYGLTFTYGDVQGGAESLDPGRAETV